MSAAAQSTVVQGLQAMETGAAASRSSLFTYMKPSISFPLTSTAKDCISSRYCLTCQLSI